MIFQMMQENTSMVTDMAINMVTGTLMVTNITINTPLSNSCKFFYHFRNT